MFNEADSLDYDIHDLYKDFYESKDMFDFSEYSQDPRIYDVTNKKYNQRNDKKDKICSNCRVCGIKTKDLFFRKK